MHGTQDIGHAAVITNNVRKPRTEAGKLTLVMDLQLGRTTYLRGSTGTEVRVSTPTAALTL